MNKKFFDTIVCLCFVTIAFSVLATTVGFLLYKHDTTEKKIWFCKNGTLRDERYGQYCLWVDKDFLLED